VVVVVVQCTESLVVLSVFFLHFTWGVDEAKCVLVTAVCVSVCVSVPHHIPTLLHGPGCKLRKCRGCPLVVHCWVDLQFVHWFRCYDKCRMQNVRECLYSLCAWLHFVWVVDHENCIVVTRVCVCVCVSVCPRPHSHTIARTQCNLGEW